MSKIIILVCKSCSVYDEEPCYVLAEVNPSKKLKIPAHCINDGKGARWVETKSKTIKKNLIKLLRLV